MIIVYIRKYIQHNLMSKRFYSFSSTEPAKKKASTEFLPWNKKDFVPKEVKDGDIKAGIFYLMNLNSSPLNKIPRIAFKHQLYSVVKSRTIVDRGINTLLENGEIKLFKTSLGTEQLSIMFTRDYIDHVKAVCSIKDSGTDFANGTSTPTSSGKDVIGNIASRFIDMVLPNLKDISINEDILEKQYGFKDQEVTEMIKFGIFTVKNAGTWWLSVPNVGSFMKLLRKGRQAVIQTIKRTKYKEINRSTLLAKKTIPSLKLDVEYHMHDLIGADLIKPIESTTGILLRLEDR